jgi:hypothetical protein
VCPPAGWPEQYIQMSDVETEINGLVTYDREVIKVDPGIFNTDH